MNMQVFTALCLLVAMLSFTDAQRGRPWGRPGGRLGRRPGNGPRLPGDGEVYKYQRTMDGIEDPFPERVVISESKDLAMVFSNKSMLMYNFTGGNGVMVFNNPRRHFCVVTNITDPTMTLTAIKDDAVVRNSSGSAVTVNSENLVLKVTSLNCDLAIANKRCPRPFETEEVIGGVPTPAEAEVTMVVPTFNGKATIIFNPTVLRDSKCEGRGILRRPGLLGRLREGLQGRKDLRLRLSEGLKEGKPLRNRLSEGLQNADELIRLGEGLIQDGMPLINKVSEGLQDAEALRKLGQGLKEGTPLEKLNMLSEGLQDIDALRRRLSEGLKDRTPLIVV